MHKPTNELYLKWTATGRVPHYQRGAPIPVGGWTALVGNPVVCLRGWHACRWEDAVHHIAAELWVCELDGPIVTGPDKVAAGRLRLVEQVTAINDRTLRLFAADCAESVLPLFEAERPNDDRPRLAIVAARAFANGEIDRSAQAAAEGAAWDAARGAWAAAEGAAWAAAWDAARGARAAAEGAARGAQTHNLLVNYAGLDPALFAHRGG